MTKIEQISQMINNLPDKDRKIAHNFLNKRKFVELKEIVDSDVVRLKRKLNKAAPKRPEDEPTTKYLNLETAYNAMTDLQTEVNSQAQAFLDLYPEEDNFYNPYEE